ncbi:MAG: YihY/virulence factor BrkB family protein [Deltaproteobacteria bacterium]|nr:YihY/virulence factor BrkB family protein [Deltaproteobacteria bacterium]MBI3389432.1 YihY/virulence factor BrkB family protein [Deltaproteobacteria bacterium]
MLESIGNFLNEVYSEWRRDNALTHGAALAYYTLFSMAPLLVLIIAIAGLALGRAVAEGELVAKIKDLIGPDSARTVEGMISEVSSPATGIIATAVSLATMLFGASGVFGQLQSSLNQIWDTIVADGTPPRGVVRRRLASFGLILGIGMLLFLSLMVSAALAALHDLLARHLPQLSGALPLLNTALSFVLTTSLFAMIYKVLPDVELHWRDVWVGAAVTAVLFSVGRTLIGVYLGRAGTASVYGAAGSLVVLLLWIYYSAQILFIGAEFTEVYSRRYGSRRAAAEPVPRI